MTDNASMDAAARPHPSPDAQGAASVGSCLDSATGAKNAGNADAVSVAIAEVEEQMAALIGHVRASLRAAALSIDPALQPFGLKILRILVANGAMHASKLADVLFVDRSIISRQAKHLQELGLVELQTDPDDGRARFVAVTELGTQRLSAVRAGDTLAIFGHMNTWPVEDLQKFTGYLKKLTEPAP